MYAFMSVVHNTCVHIKVFKDIKHMVFAHLEEILKTFFFQPCNLCFLTLLDWQAANPVPLLWLCTSPPTFSGFVLKSLSKDIQSVQSQACCHGQHCSEAEERMKKTDVLVQDTGNTEAP